MDLYLRYTSPDGIQTKHQDKYVLKGLSKISNDTAIRFWLFFLFSYVRQNEQKRGLYLCIEN